MGAEEGSVRGKYILNRQRKKLLIIRLTNDTTGMAGQVCLKDYLSYLAIHLSR